MKSLILAIIASGVGLHVLFRTKTLMTLLGKHSSRSLQYPHTQL